MNSLFLGEKMKYRCPFCGYRGITLFALKMHVQKKHATDKCPICGVKSRNITGHYYIYAKTHNDTQHLLLYYLFTRDTLNSSEKEIIEKLLKETGDSN
jgi:sarcosine oxidase delta subunit